METEKAVEVSPTALTQLSYCERQFGFKYWSGIPVQRTPQLALGTDVHDQIEIYLKTGNLDYVKNTKAANIAAKGLHLLPKPKLEGLSIEGAFKFQVSDVVFSGRMDWMYPWILQGEKVLVVGDNKTSSDPTKWGKTSEQLEDDHQAIIYGYYGLSKHPDSKAVMLKWVYFPTKNKGKACTSQLLQDPHTLTEKMYKLLPDARRVVRLRIEKPDPNSLPADTRHCNAFGGCPYRYVCKLSNEDTIRSFFKMTQSTIPSALSTIAARLGAPQPAQVPQHAPHDVNPPEAKVDVPVVAAEAKQEAQQATEAFKAAAEEKPAKKTKPAKAKLETKVGAIPTFDGQRSIGVLYVNCIPNVPHINASDFIAQAKADLRAATKTEALPDGVADYRVIDFGKGAGYLAALVEEQVKKAGFIERLVLDATTPEGQVSREVLQTLAAEIVRGIA